MNPESNSSVAVAPQSAPAPVATVPPAPAAAPARPPVFTKQPKPRKERKGIPSAGPVTAQH